MSYALVKLGSVAASLSPAFGQSTAAADLLVCWLGSNSGSATNPFTVSSGTGWTVDGFGGAFEWAGIAYKPDCGAGETAPVFADGGASSHFTMLGEFSGGALASVLDQAGNGGEGGGSDQVAQASAPDSAAGDLIIGAVFWNGGATTPTISTTLTDSSGATVTPNVVNNAGGVNPFYDFAWGIAGATLGASGDELTATLSGFSNGGCGIASFKAASGTVTAIPVPYLTQNSGMF